MRDFNIPTSFTVSPNLRELISKSVDQSKYEKKTDSYFICNALGAYFGVDVLKKTPKTSNYNLNDRFTEVYFMVIHNCKKLNNKPSPGHCVLVETPRLKVRFKRD